jgi:hypothetical protein
VPTTKIGMTKNNDFKGINKGNIDKKSHKFTFFAEDHVCIYH